MTIPRYTRQPDLAGMMADHERRLRALENALSARLRTGTAPAPTPTWDVNQLTNGDIEAGLAGWSRGFWNQTVGLGLMVVETADPLAGTRSLRMDEPAAGGQTWIIWTGGQPSNAAVSGVSVWPTVAGDSWRLQARLRTGIAFDSFQVVASFGVTPNDCYGLAGANTTWLAAVDVPTVAGQTADLSGSVITPAGRNYVTFGLRPLTLHGDPTLAPAYSWWADNCVIQRKLQ
jgi:hypothetical protein